MIGTRVCQSGGLVLVLIVSALFCVAANAQSSAVVPRLVNFSGKATDAQGKAISGIAGATFAIYKDQYEGSARWLETQNVQADAKGNYTVQLGATKPDGLPLDLFSSGEARWLGVTINGGSEQPRVLLLSVPYALKAADAETIGGLPPSAFVLVAPATSGLASSPGGNVAADSAPASPPPASSNVTTTGGVVNALPLWTTATNIQSSALTQSGTGASAKVGINTTTPASTLDVNGAETVRGNLNLPATGTATATSGKNSQPTTFTASVFNKSTGTAVPQNFRWQAEPVGNDTSAASGSLNLLYGSGSNVLSETGLHIASNGQITFAKGQTFPGTGPGTVTSVGLSAPASDFSVGGSPVTSSGTLNLNWVNNVAPTNLNIGNAIVKRDGTGSFVAGTISAGIVSANTVSASGSVSGSGATAIEGFGTSIAGGAAGVYGQLVTPSLTGQQRWTGGVWGDTGVQDLGGGGVAVLGTADDAPAGIFLNNSPSGVAALYALSYDSSGPMFSATNFSNNDDGCSINQSGNLYCTGTKSAVVLLDDGKRKVALSAIESPENWFEDFGSARLVNGVAIVRLDPDFMQTVNTEKDYRVFPVPNGDCKGLYVTNKTPNSFEIRELGAGTSNVAFDYRITAIRRKYEKVRFADHTNDPDPRKMLEHMRKAKPAASSGPASTKPPSTPVAGVPVENP